VIRAAVSRKKLFCIHVESACILVHRQAPRLSCGEGCLLDGRRALSLHFAANNFASAVIAWVCLELAQSNMLVEVVLG